MMLYDPATNEWAAEPTATTVEVSIEAYSALMGKTIEPGPDGQPRVTRQQTRADLFAAVAAKRWAVETGGLVMGGLRIDTSVESQNKIANVVSVAPKAGVEEVKFKTYDDDGVPQFTSMSIDQVDAIAGAIGLHQAACFDAEAAHVAAIKALAEEDLAGYDIEQGWPA